MDNIKKNFFSKRSNYNNTVKSEFKSLFNQTKLKYKA